MPRVLCSIVLLMTTAAAAEELPGAALYRQKMCVACHAADGSGNTPAGKATKARDLRSAEVQKATDAGLADVIAAGRGKCRRTRARCRRIRSKPSLLSSER